MRLDLLDQLTNRGPRSKADAVNVAFALSSTTFIVKGLSPGVTVADLDAVFRQYSGLKEVLLPPYGVTAIVTYELSQQAKVAYQNCAYMEVIGDFSVFLSVRVDLNLLLPWLFMELRVSGLFAALNTEVILCRSLGCLSIAFQLWISDISSTYIYCCRGYMEFRVWG